MFRVKGQSMVGAHIHDGDLVIVDRALEARDKDIVLAVLDGEFTIKRLRRSRGRVEEVEAKRKNICCSRSFGRPVETLEELCEAVATHMTRAGEKLRTQGLAASAIHVFMHTNPRRPELPQYSPGAGRELLVPTQLHPRVDRRGHAGAAGHLQARLPLHQG